MFFSFRSTLSESNELYRCLFLKRYRRLFLNRTNVIVVSFWIERTFFFLSIDSFWIERTFFFSMKRTFFVVVVWSLIYDLWSLIDNIILIQRKRVSLLHESCLNVLVRGFILHHDRLFLCIFISFSFDYTIDLSLFNLFYLPWT